MDINNASFMLLAALINGASAPVTKTLEPQGTNFAYVNKIMLIMIAGLVAVFVLIRIGRWVVHKIDDFE